MGCRYGRNAASTEKWKVSEQKGGMGETIVKVRQIEEIGGVSAAD